MTERKAASRRNQRTGKAAKTRSKSSARPARAEPGESAAGPVPPRWPLVVGIGASAGGLQAFTSFLANMPADSGMAFVLVQHLAPDHKSMLADLLGRATPMQVVEAADGMAADAGRVFVIPPNATMTIEQGRLRVESPAPPREFRRPIDTFFSSLADDLGERAVCIVLSGTGSDGALGLTAIKENGGFTMAQAEFEQSAMGGMPHSAVATGFVDDVLPVQDMPARLLSYQQHLRDVASRKQADGTRADAAEHLTTIARLLRAKVGHDFSEYKDKTVTRRIQRRMQVLQIDTVPGFIARLREDPHQLDLLFRELLISVTQFFRDPPSFEALQARVVPSLLAGKGEHGPIRIWVPGCATGEEAYSIAILLKEAMQAASITPKVQIFGTDIDQKAIEFARAARYVKMAGLSPEKIGRWFSEEAGCHIPVKEIREMCIFSVQSVVKDPPFSKLDLISCRNLLIYMDSALQDRVLRTFHYALNPDGFLFLGPSEGVARQSKFFTGLDKKHRIFQRRDIDAVLPDLTPNMETSAARSLPDGALRLAAEDDQIARKAHHAMEKYSPAYLVIDGDNTIARFSGGQAGRYLEPTTGTASLNLYSILRSALRPVVRAAVRTALATRTPAVQPDVAVRIDGANQSVTVIAEPILGGDEAGYCVVAFQEAGQSGKRGQTGPAAPPGPANADVRAIEHELRTVKTQLQSTIDELETANEEMKSAAEEYQSVNEELQSSNEELETSKEEMQSVNEELQTVNAEMAAKNDALNRANSDLKNLLDSTEIATLFLDADLRVKNFTPRMTRLFHLRDTDRGRPITEIVSLLDYADLERDVADVAHNLTMVEREVQLDDQGMTFILRIRPYKTVENVIDGVVMTFLDISERKRADDRTAMLLGELDHRVKNILAIVSSIVALTLKTAESPEAFAASMEGRISAIARAHGLLTEGGGSGEALLRDLIERELAPYDRHGMNVKIAGPSVLLTPKAGLTLAMVVHELASNASKYGALSTPEGHLAVNWNYEGRGDACRLTLDWLETGGPPVSPPAREGFGTTLIERTIGYEMDGTIAREFLPSGLHCSIAVPLTGAVGHLSGGSAESGKET